MRRRVLLAEPASAVRQLVVLALFDRNVDIDAVEDGDRAEELLQRGSYHLVIADRDLPDRDGLELARNAAALQKPPPVLLLSARVDREIEEEADSAGAAGVLGKPFEAADLQDRVDALLAQRDSQEVRLQGTAADPTDGDEEDGVPATLSDKDVERIARKVVELIGDGQLREVAWEVLPDMAEIVIRERLAELEAEADDA